MRRHAPRRFATEWPTPVRMWVDRAKARFSSWYELFPRSASPDPARHGTLRDVEGRLDADRRRWGSTCCTCRRSTRSAGRSARGGTTPPRPSRATSAARGRSAAPRAGTTPIHPRPRHARRLRPPRHARPPTAASRSRWTWRSSARRTTRTSREHPEWFRHRPDGTIQYAENPPKKYQDIYPFDFECEDWQALWNELLRVVLFWHGHGVRDLPRRQPAHQAVPVLGVADRARCKQRDPDVLFLAEAFTRPKVMYRLAQARVHAVVHLLRLAERPVEHPAVLHRADDAAGGRLLPPQRLAQHAGHPPEYLQTDAPRGVRRAGRAGRHAVRQLRRLRPGVRADGRPAGAARQRGVPGLGEVPDPPVGPQPARFAGRPAGPAEPHPPDATPPCSTTAGSDVPQRRTTRRSSASARRTGDNVVLVVVNTDPHHTQWAQPGPGPGGTGVDAGPAVPGA